jgi:hypothetical protein
MAQNLFFSVVSLQALAKGYKVKAVKQRNLSNGINKLA